MSIDERTADPPPRSRPGASREESAYGAPVEWRAAGDPASGPDLSELLKRVSHEVRSPLSAILIWSDLLRRDQLTPEQREEGLCVLERSALLLKELLDKLVAASSRSAGDARSSDR